MKLIDGHMHLEYGPLTKDYVMKFIDSAISMGLNEIQILDHTHRFVEFMPLYDNLRFIEKQDKWLKGELKFRDSLDDYLKLIKEMKNEELPIKVSFGLEVCYVPEYKEFLKNLLRDCDFDFLVGAVHSIDGRLYDMPFSNEILWDAYDSDYIYRRYYDLLIDCVKSGLFDQLAHPDTIKMFNIYPSYNLSDTYNRLCDVLLDNDVKAENNTGCHYRYNHHDVGLSDDLLRAFKDRGVKLIAASDAHHPEDVGKYIKEATQKIID